MMMEQYLDGAEVDVDVVLSEGVAVYSEVTDNWPTIEPYFQEVGANCPSQLTPVQQAELVELSVAATLSLGAPRLRGCMFVCACVCFALLTRVGVCVWGAGFTCGVFHVESKYTTHGARLIEVNCRMGASPQHARVTCACVRRRQQRLSARCAQVACKCATSTC